MLDDIPLIGKHRKQCLLEHFGSVNSVKKASLVDLKAVKGINNKTAELVFLSLHKKSK
jgi:excinuclease ABC subunit C